MFTSVFVTLTLTLNGECLVGLGLDALARDCQAKEPTEVVANGIHGRQGPERRLGRSPLCQCEA